MAEDKNLLNALQEYNELCHETWIGGLDFASSYWDENMNATKKQIEFWSLIDKDWRNRLDRFLQKIPFETLKKGYDDKAMVRTSIAKLIEANEDYLSYLATISNMIAKEQLRAMKKNTENGFSIFGEYLKSFTGKHYG